jgi:hypothetical protein
MAARKGPAMRRTDASVEEFLARVPDERRRQDARRLCAMMQQVIGEPPVIWGTSIIGFGTYHYRYASGREGDSALASFAPRSQHRIQVGVLFPAGRRLLTIGHGSPPAGRTGEDVQAAGHPPDRPGPARRAAARRWRPASAATLPGHGRGWPAITGQTPGPPGRLTPSAASVPVHPERTNSLRTIGPPGGPRRTRIQASTGVADISMRPDRRCRANRWVPTGNGPIHWWSRYRSPARSRSR